MTKIETPHFRKVIIIIGYAGSGKSKDAPLIADDEINMNRVRQGGIPIISSGDLAREHWEDRKYWTVLAPEETMRSIMENELDRESYHNDVVILDGFPRNESQFRHLLRVCSISRIEIKCMKASLFTSLVRYVKRARKGDTLIRFISEAIRFIKFRSYLLKISKNKHEKITFKN